MVQVLQIADARLLPRRVSACPLPTDPVRNASYVLSYTGANLTQIDMVLDGTTFRRTLTYSGSTLTDISAWVQL